MALQINNPRYGNIFVDCDTFDELRSVPTAQIKKGHSAIVNGGSSNLDGLGGIFVWDSLSNLADDSESVIAPRDGQTGRWRGIAIGKTGIQGIQGFTGPRGPVGDPGGNVMAIGLFTSASGINISPNTSLIYTSGHTRRGVGAARYSSNDSITAAYVTTHPRSSFVASDGRVFSLAEPVLYPEFFGSIGDGIFDDHDGFRALSALVNEMKSASIAFVGGANYVVGRQVAHPAGPQYGYLVPQNPIDISKCDNISIDLGGAKFKFRDGLKFGSFNPATGEKLGTTLPYYTYASRAEVGTMFMFQGVKNLGVYGSATLNLNSRNVNVGGGWGDTGFQLVMYGIFYGEIDNLISVASIYAYDSLLDLFCYRYYPLLETESPKLAYIRNLYGERAGRNVISIVGGNNVDIDSCVFRDPGQGYYEGGAKRIASSPASCCDVEAEGSVIRNCHFGRNVYFIGGPYANTAFVADSGDTRGIVNEGRMYGTVWTSKPRTTFLNATIKGYFAKLAGGAVDTDDNTIIDNCDIYDTTEYASKDASVGGGLLMDGSGAGPGVKLLNSRIRASKFQFRTDGWVSRNNRFFISVTTASVANRDYVAIMTHDVDGDVWYDMIPASGAPEDGYSITFNTPPTGNAEIMQTSGSNTKLRWFSWSVGGGGYPNPAQTDGRLTAKRQRLASINLTRSDGAFSGGYYGYRRILSLPAMPTTGTYAKDDFVLAESATIVSGQIVFGWLRLTNGSNHVAGTDWFVLKFGDTPAATA